MNCTSRVRQRVLRCPGQPALWTSSGASLTFGDLGRTVAGVQRMVHDAGVEAGEAVLVLGPPGPRLFAATLGLLGSGITAILVEPHLPAPHIDEMIRRLRPRALVASALARLWSARIPAIRSIPVTVPLSRVRHVDARAPFRLVELNASVPGTITLGEETRGSPGMLVRTHGCIQTLLDLLCGSREGDAVGEPGLCAHPTPALLHLAAGRGTILLPAPWTRWSLRRAAAIARSVGPTTLSCGPGFLARLLAYADRRPGTFTSLRRVTVQGAQVDCDLLERSFARWPRADWLQVYGASHVEPVAMNDARNSVRSSRDRGLFQALLLGSPVPGLETRIEPSGLWVRGPHVARRLGDGPPASSMDSRPSENTANHEWHSVGDRIEADVWGWWFGGRALQPKDEFCLEQRLYADLGTSACFVSRDRDGRLFLYGEGFPAEAREFRRSFQRRYPELCGVRGLRIVEDRRHHAGIDRRASLSRAGWSHDG